MIATKNRPLTAKEHSTIEYYLDPASESYNNWCESYKKANYSTSKGWKANAKRVHDKDPVLAEIAKRRAKVMAKVETTIESVQKLYQDAYDSAKDYKQPSAMVSAATGIARLHGMDKDAQQTTPQDVAITETEQAVIDQFNKDRYNTGPKLSTPQATGAAPVHEQGQGVAKVGSRAKEA